MKTERLIVLVSPEEKARISKLAKQRHTSVGTLVRTALSRFENDLDRPEGEVEAEPLAEQAAARRRGIGAGACRQAGGCSASASSDCQ